MPGADRGVEEILKMFRLPSGTYNRRWRRIEMPVGLNGRRGTKAAHTENENDAPERFHPAASTLIDHARSPLSDQRRLEKHLGPRCEAGHAGLATRKEWQ